MVVTFSLASIAGAIASCAGLEVAWGSMEGCLGAATGAGIQVVTDVINAIFAVC